MQRPQLHSRIHRLISFDTAHAKAWVKREDELGFGISGSKRRKYLSLIAGIQQENWEIALIIGGRNSNNLVGLAQQLNEHKIPFVAFVKAGSYSPKKGNQFLFSLLTSEEQVIEVPTEDWPRVEEIAHEYLLMQSLKGGVIAEGGSHPFAIEGLCTLMDDIEYNEQQQSLSFQHIFIDAGTAFTAAVLAWEITKRNRNTQLHIVHIAGGEADFLKNWQLCETHFGQSLSPQNISHYKSITAASFGSVNRTVLAFIRTMAHTEGILTDPIYTAKTFLTVQDIIRRGEIAENVLIVHSGGGTGLMGFADSF